MAMEWISHDKEYRQANAGAILEVLRLPLLSPNYLCHTFESNYFLQNDSQCKSVIQEAMSVLVSHNCELELSSICLYNYLAKLELTKSLHMWLEGMVSASKKLLGISFLHFLPKQHQTFK
jgi:uncharacterized protein YejL (UPF0352 family)